MQYVHSMWLFSSANIKNFLKKAFIDTGIYMFLLLLTVFKKCEFWLVKKVMILIYLDSWSSKLDVTSTWVVSDVWEW